MLFGLLASSSTRERENSREYGEMEETQKRKKMMMSCCWAVWHKHLHVEKKWHNMPTYKFCGTLRKHGTT